MTNAEATLYLLVIPVWALLLWLAERYEKSLGPKAVNRRSAMWCGIKAGLFGSLMWLIIIALLLGALYSLATGRHPLQW